MKKKGFTLIEIIIAIALIGIIAVAFIPFMTFSYTKLVHSEKFTQDMFNDQAIVENQIDTLRFEEPKHPHQKTFNFFGVDIDTHDIQVNTSSSGKVHVLLPKQTLIPPIPIIKDPPEIIVRKNGNFAITPQPNKINLLEGEHFLFVDEVIITPETRNDHLMNVYRWYTTDEVSQNNVPSNDISNFIIIHEWNEARPLVNFQTALENNFIPNFKEYTVSGSIIPYNRLNFSSIKNHTGLNTEDMINRYGNRHVVYGVTPYSLAGRMGLERFSNSIYIEAPRIVIESAEFLYVPQENEIVEGEIQEEINENTIIIRFNVELTGEINPIFFKFDESIGEPSVIALNSYNHHELILEFDHEINKTMPIGNNFITRGAVVSKDYGAISIWSNGEPNASFIINPSSSPN